MVFVALGLALFQVQAPDSLSLSDALRQSRAQRGQVATARARMAAARAGIRQAGTIPNPVGSYEYTEDTPRQHATLDQSFDWLLTRGPAREAGQASLAGAEADSAQLEADLAAEVRRAFYGALAGQAVRRLVEAEAAIADTLAQIAEHRFASGDISRLEADAAVLESQRVRLNLSRARATEAATGAELGRSLGWSDSVAIPPLAGDLGDGLGEAAAELPAEAQIPGIRAAVAESTAALLRLRATSRAWVPLPSVLVGVEWSDPSQPGETLGLVGLSMPLPIWNQGGGDRAAATATAEVAAAEARERRLTTRAALATAGTRLREAEFRAGVARDSLLPAAQRLRERATQAYQAGETGILPVLEALRTEREVSATAVDDLLTFQEAVAEWNRLIGVTE